MRKNAAVVKPPAPVALHSPPTLHVHNLSLGSDLLGKVQPKSPTSKAALNSHVAPGSSTRYPRTRSPAKPAAAAPAAASQNGQSQTEPVVLEALAFPTEGFASTQTDTFARVPLPPSDLLLKTGLDAATSTSDLFDFESEVAPILEMLVGRALEAAQFEAEDELRLAAIRQRRRHLEEVRYRELVDVQRMEGDDRRRLEARLRQQRELADRAQRQQVLEDKVGVLGLARDMARGALDGVAGQLQRSESAPLASLSSAAEQEVVGYLEAAGIRALEAMRCASTPRPLSAAGSSRRASGQPLSRLTTATSQPRSKPLSPRASAGGGATPVPRPATALAAELAGTALRQAEVEAALATETDVRGLLADGTAAAYRPPTAVAVELVSEAMERLQAAAAAELLSAAQDKENVGQLQAAALEPRPPTALAAELASKALAQEQSEALTEVLAAGAS